MAGIAAENSFLYTYSGTTLKYTYLKDGDAVTGLSVSTTGPVKGNVFIPENASDGTNSYPVKRIANQAFAYSDSLAYIGLPAQLECIGDSAFCGCTGLWMNSIKIPQTVTKIGRFAFFSCRKLLGVTFSDTPCTIGEQAFWGCNWFTKLTIPAAITEIGDYAFDSCYWLNTIDIQGGNTKFGEGVFYGCENLVTLTLPEGMDSIPSRMFANCTKLATLTLPSTLKSVGMRAFTSCPITSLTFPASLTQIKESAFSGTALTEVSIPTTLKTIGREAFGSCGALTSARIPSTTTVGEYAFQKCYQLGSVVFYKPESAEEIAASRAVIDRFAFSGAKIESIDIPDGIVAIRANAFDYCRNLTTARFPSTITELGFNIFSDSYNPTYNNGHVTSLYCAAKVPPVGDAWQNGMNESFINYVTNKCTLYVPAESLEAYRTAALWKNFFSIQPYNFTDNPSGIGSVEADTENTPAAVYDLQGRRVTNPRNGIYIVNGTKTLIH